MLHHFEVSSLSLKLQILFVALGECCANSCYIFIEGTIRESTLKHQQAQSSGSGGYLTQLKLITFKLESATRRNGLSSVAQRLAYARGE